ncbi:reverse transcriptase domain-containing protein [Tanacetum coccineum]
MPPRMRTRSAGWPIAKSRGGGMGERVGRGGRGRGPRRYNDESVDELNGQGNDQNVLVNDNQVGYSYKEFLACNPKEYDGKGGAIVLTRWIEKMESVQDMSGCSIDQKVKYIAGSFVEEFFPSHKMQKLEIEVWNHAIVRAGHTSYTDRFHELAMLVPHLVTLKSRKIERYMYGLAPQIYGMVAATEPKSIQKAVQISGALTDEEERIWVLGPSVPPTTPTMHSEGLVTHASTITAQGHGNQWNQARGRAFILGADEACQDPNIVMGTFTLNDHYATTLFDSGANYSFISTTFIPLLDIEPTELGFSYEIEIASGQLVEINKVIKGMDWLSDHKAEIICHEKVVRILLLDDKVLRVLGEKPEEKVRQLMSATTKEQKQEEIVVVKDFLG